MLWLSLSIPPAVADLLREGLLELRMVKRDSLEHLSAGGSGSSSGDPPAESLRVSSPRSMMRSPSWRRPPAGRWSCARMRRPCCARPRRVRC